MTGKDIKSFLPIMYITGTFVASQKHWAIYTKEAYRIYMSFQKPYRKHLGRVYFMPKMHTFICFPTSRKEGKELGMTF